MYWVIDTKTLETRVHRGPASTGYGEIVAVQAGVQLQPRAAPELVIGLGDLDLD